MADLNTESSHVAFADESSYTADRFRSLGTITLPAGNLGRLCQTLEQLLQESSVRELKWHKLSSARERFAAIKLVDLIIAEACMGGLRVDVLVWDTQDSRHAIRGRDDIANLQIMYYHLFRNVLLNRWPSGSTWALYPDENSALDWTAFRRFLGAAGGVSRTADGGLLDTDPFYIRLVEEYRIICLEEICSTDSVLCQVADLFAGLGAFSHSSYNRYAEWLQQASGQLQLPLGLDDPINAPFTRSERERFTVLRHLDARCKQYKLYVSLKKFRGLKTYKPGYPVNFWPYTPQTLADRAPTRDV